MAGLNPGRGKGDKAPAAKLKSAAPKSVSTSRRTKTEKFTASTVGQIACGLNGIFSLCHAKCLLEMLSQ